MEEISIQHDNIQYHLAGAYDDFRKGNLEDGLHKLDFALSVDFDNPEVISSLKCSNYWRDRFATSEEMSSPFEKAEYLFNQWKAFPAFAERVGNVSERCSSSLKQLVYESCLGLYREFADEASGAKDPDILLRVGKCYKALGAYDKALQVLDGANQLKKDHAEILAELADCYALVNEMQISKAFFREAFFIDPQGIDYSSIESEMILRLIGKLRGMGFTSPVLEEWIPVYGVLYGVLTVKRELRSIEYGKLRQSIYALEVELRENPSKKEAIMPRLLNRYFWLIDHYVSVKEHREKIDEILIKIKDLNPALYDLYTN